MKSSIIHGDALAVLESGKLDGKVDLVVTSPPYDDLRSYNGYEFNAAGMLAGLYRAVKKGGVVVWNVADATKNGGRTGTSFRQALAAQAAGFIIHDVMIWSKPNPAYQHPNRYTNAFEYVFVFSKGKPAVFNGERISCSQAGKAASRWRSSADGGWDKTGARGEIQATKMHSNVWTWRAGAKPGPEHPASYPIELPLMAVRTWTRKGGLVLDPMNGSGTTCLAAKRLGRRWIGIDVSADYCALAEQRLAAELA